MRSSGTFIQPTTEGKKEREMERKLIMTILDKIDKFKIETDKRVKKTNEVMKGTGFQLRQIKYQRQHLFDHLKAGFESVKDLFRRDRDLISAAKMPQDYLAELLPSERTTKDEIDHIEWQTNTALLTKISDKLAEIEKYTADKTNEFLERMESMKTDATTQWNGLNDMDNYFKKEFSEVKELIRKNCIMHKEDEFLG